MASLFIEFFMDFFKSVFSKDPSLTSSLFPTSSSFDHNPKNSPTSPSDPRFQNPDAKPKSPSVARSSWTTLLKTVVTKSESVLGNYHWDLEEFSFGLRKKMAIIREAASYAVRDLPGRLESGATVAQTSLESVGQVIDNLVGAVSDIIIHAPISGSASTC